MPSVTAVLCILHEREPFLGFGLGRHEIFAGFQVPRLLLTELLKKHASPA